VEVDGGQHNASAKDAERTAWLESQGFHLLRFWNNPVLREISAVTNAIWEALSCDRETPHLNPPPQGGRRYSTPGRQPTLSRHEPFFFNFSEQGYKKSFAK